MRFSTRAALPALLVVLAAGAATGTAERSTAGTARAGASAKAGRLVAFGSCGNLLGYAKTQAARFVGPWGLGGPVTAVGVGSPSSPVAPAAQARESSPQEGVDYSGTNVQEVGVDEPDLVKTNGTTLFAVANGMLNAVDVTGAKPRLLDTLKLDGGWSHELLLYGNRLLVLSRGGYWAEPLPALSARLVPYSPAQSVLAEVDVSDPSKLRIVRTLTLDGAYVAARLVGGTARIVASSQVPVELPFVQPQSSTKQALAAAAKRNRAVVASSGVLRWLPSYRLKRPGAAATKARPLVQCRDVRRPPAFSGLGMLTVLTVDLAKGLEPVDSVAVMTDARIVYASQASLYVATERWADRPDPDTPTQEPGSGVTTAIHKFDISSPTKTQYLGSGTVSGYLLSQWSLSEFGGALRVVSTETPAWWGEGGASESYLTTLRERDGALVQSGRLGGLGKGERVYAVRFVGNTGYVVTFRQVDPLYTLDLTDPAHPRVLGELEIAGYSAYLHPIGEDLLLGIGQEADQAGHLLGTQLSIFDVSDLRNPKLLDRAPLGPGWSEAESDHHAFLFWPRTGLVVIPFVQQAAGFRVGRALGIVDVGRIEHGTGQLGWTAPIRRALVVGNTVVTVSDAGVESSSLDTLAKLGWASFPPPAPAPGGPVPLPGSSGSAKVGG
jgi:uncharacterized secreted protein with C-terminal beta-propeller domain